MEVVDINQNNKMPKMPVKSIVFGGIIVLLLIIAFNSVYTVDDKQQAVVLTFGEVTSIEGSGMHFKFPDPIQSVIKVPVQQTQKLELGYREESDGDIVVVDEESKMITGDYNIVKIDFFLEWKISDPKEFLFSSVDPEGILRNLSLSAARSVVGSSTIDEALTSGKLEIQTKIKEKVMDGLEQYNIGVQLIDLKIQDSETPSAEVKRAFENVESAKQSKETAINEANKYKNAEMPKAQAESDKIVRKAESKRQEKINEAKGQVAKFQKMYEEYKNYKDITKKRLYLEAMEEILPGITVYIENDSGQIQKILPLKSFDSKGEN